LVPVLNPKNTTFSPLGPVLSPHELRKKAQNFFFWVFVLVQISYFKTYKFFEKFTGSIWGLVLPSKKIKKTKVVPDTNYGVFRCVKKFYSLKLSAFSKFKYS
jgi:hypothetical protein